MLKTRIPPWQDDADRAFATIVTSDLPLLILVDELPVLVLALANSDPSGARVRAFLQWFRNLRQRPDGASKLRFVLAGSIGLDNVTRRHRLTDTINDLRLWPLGPFEHSAAHEFLGRLADSYRLRLDRELREAICGAAEWLIPYHLQVIFGALREHARTSQPTTEMLGSVIEGLLDQRTYFSYWDERLHDCFGAPSDSTARALLAICARAPGGATPAAMNQTLTSLVPDIAERAKAFTWIVDVLSNDGYLVEHTGGTPRTLALLHTVLALDHSDRIERDLEGLLDQLTPYYKARFDDLPAQSQVIVDKVALHWHPITAAACQAATHLDLNTVSAQLSRLVKNGLLTKVSLPGPNKLGFQLSERFFNIWYLMRASRRLRRRLSWFVEFLRVFYGEEDLRRRAEDLVRAAPHASLNSPAKFLAFASAIPDDALRRRLEFRAIGPLMSDGIAAIREVMDLEGEDAHLAPVVDRVRALREIRARITKARVRWPAGHTSDSIAEMLVRHPIYPLHVKQKLAWLIEHSKFEELNISIEVMSRVMAGFDIQLLDAIASGELPALSDVTTAAEVRQLIELGKPGWITAEWLVISTEVFGRPLTDKTVQLLLQLAPQVNNGIMIAASTLVGLGRWPRARHLVLQIARQFTGPPDIAALVIFTSTCIARGLAAEAADLLVEAGLAERWAPLSEVLRAVADGSKSRLDGLAPAVRVAAIELFDLIRVPAALPARDGGFDLDSNTGPPPKPNATSRQRLGARKRKQGRHPRRPGRNCKHEHACRGVATASRARSLVERRARP